MTSNQRPVTPAHCLACKARFRSHDTARACRLCGGTVVAEAECVEEVFAALDASREETAAWSRDLSAMLVRAETAERERDEALAQVKEEAGKDLSAEPAKVEPCGKPFRGPEVAGKSGTFACNRPSGHEGACGQTFAGFFGSPAAEPRS